jgi:DinB superfamily
MIIGCLLTASSAFAQSANPFVSELKQFYTIRKGDLLKAADRMPSEGYDFKPAPDMRSFGQLIAHIADAQMTFCSGAKGQPIHLNAASKTSKVDLVAALKASFDECDGVFDSTTDATAIQRMTAGDTQRSKFWSLLYATLHDNEEYGYLAVYLRLRNLVPPSTDSR